MAIIEKKKWWLSNRKIAGNYVREARRLIATKNNTNIASAIIILDTALSLSPSFDLAMELKARSLLHLRRFKQIAEMLQDYIPSVIRSNDYDAECSSLFSFSYDQPLSGEHVKLLPNSSTPDQDIDHLRFNCFSIYKLKKKIMDTLSNSSAVEEQWRFLVLGQACCHLGLMEDAMLLLQTGKRLAAAAFRLESISWTDDSFSLSSPEITTGGESFSSEQSPKTESENITQLLTYIKFLIRRKSAAVAALDAGLYSEAVRHFTKLVEGRRRAPQGFIAECYMNRALAYQSLGRIADAIADCNRTLALDPSCLEALSIRASLFETIRCLPDSLHDLEHMKLLYNSILRDRRLLGPAWKPKTVQYREIPGKLCSLTTRIQKLKQRVASGEIGNVDYYGLIGLRRGINRRSDLERAHLLLSLRHKPDKAIGFLERVELAEEEEDGVMESVKDRANISALWLYRLILKGHNSVMATIIKEEEEENKHRRVLNTSSSSSSSPPAVFQGRVFCRDLAEVGNLLSQAGFNHRPIPVKYEALSC
ncbi:uncharacterized protein LOC124915724 [Impatiens glandulifera]|uniref:uncharacterized protein LOC124915724 n=1 Tax=Impatiens glandulifera TaxID=253017 RepID=UPI001FB07800|nr:uncharacterized protein LOC124915724 [Impatiens glandulifera]